MRSGYTKERGTSATFADVDRRMALSFGALILALMVMVAMVGGLYLNRIMKHEEDHLSTILTQVLASSVSRVSFAGKYHARQLLQEIKAAQPDIRYLLLAKPNGQILAHSDSTINDVKLPEKTRTIIKNVLKRDASYSRLLNQDGEAIHEVTLPYRGGYGNAIVGVIQVGLSQQQRNQALESGVIYISLLLFILFMISIVLTRYISEYFGKPIKALADDLSTTLQTIPDLLFEVDKDGRFTQVLTHSDDLLLIPREKLLNNHLENVLSPEAAESFYAALNEAEAAGESFGHLIMLSTEKGEFWFELSIARKRASSDGTTSFVVLSHDITESRRMELQLRALAESNQLILDSAGEGIFGLDTNGVMTFVNPAAANILGYAQHELIGQPSHATWHYKHRDGSEYSDAECPIYSTVHGGHKSAGEETFIRKDGTFFPVSYSSTPIIKDGTITGSVITFVDITEKKEAEARIDHLAYYDALTELPNRTLLTERLTQALSSSRRLKQQGVLILINIDRFKNINDALGQAAGDDLLISVSMLLQPLLREGDTLARIAGDEFAILLPELGDQLNEVSHHAHTVAERIHENIRQPLVLSYEELSFTVSLGITLYPENEKEGAKEVIRRADTALHRVKAIGGNQSAFFETNMGEAVEQRFRIERELRRGIHDGELRLFVQPQVDARQKLVGAEVLVRWEHPEKGLVPPGVFIPLAEESDLIIELGEWVLNQSLQFMVESDMAGMPIHLSVNLSPRHFRQTGFVPWLKEILALHGADPTHLTLEVTEGLFIDDINDIIAKMSELNALGIHFSIDDFGTGYSSLSYLKRLPIHELKIDRSFIQDVSSDKEDAALVETILSVARHMNLKVVAEGVETEEQAAFLNERSDIIHQGYLYGKPKPAKEWFEIWQKSTS
ncbi:MAG: EAL domain-containing protein [Gammaproteobacteria bacterium]|nr:EAL domain-containing protein [Gammaproteobacteria bacterium]